MSGEGSCKWHAETPMSSIVVVKFKGFKFRVFGPAACSMAQERFSNFQITVPRLGHLWTKDAILPPCCMNMRKATVQL